MDTVVQLVNRLQSVATKLGDNAATAKEGGLPSLWDLLPSIVVIGGQVGWLCADSERALQSGIALSYANHWSKLDACSVCRRLA